MLMQAHIHVGITSHTHTNRYVRLKGLDAEFVFRKCGVNVQVHKLLNTADTLKGRLQSQLIRLLCTSAEPATGQTFIMPQKRRVNTFIWGKKKGGGEQAAKRRRHSPADNLF